MKINSELVLQRVQTHRAADGRLFRVMIGRVLDGERFAKVMSEESVSLVIPLSWLALCSGKDVWMREIEYKCATCGERHPAKDMQCELCPACFSKSEEDNGPGNPISAG